MVMPLGDAQNLSRPGKGITSDMEDLTTANPDTKAAKEEKDSARASRGNHGGHGEEVKIVSMAMPMGMLG